MTDLAAYRRVLIREQRQRREARLAATLLALCGAAFAIVAFIGEFTLG